MPIVLVLLRPDDWSVSSSCTTTPTGPLVGNKWLWIKVSDGGEWSCSTTARVCLLHSSKACGRCVMAGLETSVMVQPLPIASLQLAVWPIFLFTYFLSPRKTGIRHAIEATTCIEKRPHTVPVGRSWWRPDSTSAQLLCLLHPSWQRLACCYVSPKMFRRCAMACVP